MQQAAVLRRNKEVMEVIFVKTEKQCEKQFKRPPSLPPEPHNNNKRKKTQTTQAKESLGY